MFASAGFRGVNRANFAKAVAVALRQPGGFAQSLNALLSIGLQWEL
jgi:hypothetical protein